MEQREKDITTLAADLDYELEEDLKPPDCDPFIRERSTPHNIGLENHQGYFGGS